MRMVSVCRFRKGAYAGHLAPSGGHLEYALHPAICAMRVVSLRRHLEGHVPQCAPLLPNHLNLGEIRAHRPIQPLCVECLILYVKQDDYDVREVGSVPDDLVSDGT